MSSTQFQANATIHIHRHDLPEGVTFGAVVAVDTEAMGLNPHRDACAWCSSPPATAPPT